MDLIPFSSLLTFTTSSKSTNFETFEFILRFEKARLKVLLKEESVFEFPWVLKYISVEENNFVNSWKSFFFIF